MNLHDCYRTLELEAGASLEQVKRSYRELAQVWHPDRFAGKPELQHRAESKLKEINVAYRELVRRLEADASACPPEGRGAGDTARGRPGGGTRTHRQEGPRRRSSAPAGAAPGGPTAADASAPASEPAAAPASAPAREPPRPRVAALRSDRRVWLLAAAVCLALFTAATAIAWHRREPVVEAIALPPGGPARLTAVAAGTAHSCGLAADGRLFCWGADDTGQLGRATTRTCTDASAEAYACDPQAAPVAGSHRFGEVAVGLDHTCALAYDGTAYCWGAAYAGQLGDGGNTSRSAPASVSSDLVFQSLSALGQHTCALTDEGEAYCWGRDTDGQLGDPRALRMCRLGSLVFGCAQAPVWVDGPGPWVQVAAGASHSCALAEDGTASCWGSNRSGQLGAGTDEVCPDESGENPCALRPVQVETPLKFSSITAGAAHTCGLALDSLAYCWGRNDAGQLGTGRTSNRAVPAAVAGQHRFARIFAGGFHTCAITATGELYCWGQNAAGQLGTSGGQICQGIRCAPAPRRVDVANVVSGSAGFYGTCVLTRARQLCWGRNDSGQLGSGATRPGDARLAYEPVAQPGRPEGVAMPLLRGLYYRAQAAIGRAKQRADLPKKLERDGRW